jgi:hypothetical protein
MNRRGFLSAIAGAFVADPEKLLWVPGAKLISIPRPRIATDAECLEVLNGLIKLWSLQPVLEFNAVGLEFNTVGIGPGYKLGDTMTIRKPPHFIAYDEAQPDDDFYRFLRTSKADRKRGSRR